jgi:peptidoglycan/LPS O-acetylase OafA/YrhL
VGRISYCLYLCHLLVRNLLYHYVLGLPTYLYVLLTFVVSVAIASASWRLLEARVLRAAWPRRASRRSRESRPWTKERGRGALYPDRA